jgi:hypothetical protein
MSIVRTDPQNQQNPLFRAEQPAPERRVERKSAPLCYLVLNSIGLTLDIAGVVLLFKYGLPAEVSRTGAQVVAYGSDPDEKKRYKRYQWGGRIGLALLIGGFGLQLASNLLQL